MVPTHVDIVVHGKVQGVWYRKTAVDVATALGLTGYAMNLPDGTVRIEAEGPADKVEEFLAWCSKGPPLALVAAVEHSPGPVRGYAHFETRR